MEKHQNFEFTVITLNKLIEKNFQLKSYANATRENYIYYLKKDIEKSFIGCKKVKDIKNYDVQPFYKEKSDGGYADGTQRRSI